MCTSVFHPPPPLPPFIPIMVVFIILACVVIFVRSDPYVKVTFVPIRDIMYNPDGQKTRIVKKVSLSPSRSFSPPPPSLSLSLSLLLFLTPISLSLPLPLSLSLSLLILYHIFFCFLDPFSAMESNSEIQGMHCT